MPTEAIQDYLKTIYLLRDGRSAVSTSRIAERLSVSRASVSAMLRKLDSRGLVQHVRYKGVRLTRKGEAIALEVIRHHRLLELYLERVVGLPWDKVHAEAEVLEHVLSEDLEARLDEQLGFPRQDPHGHPIPDAGLGLDEPSLRSLADLEAGRTGVVSQVSDSDPELLRHLGNLGLRPGTQVAVVESIPFGGGVRARVGRTEHVIAPEAARAVEVSARGGTRT